MINICFSDSAGGSLRLFRHELGIDDKIYPLNLRLHVGDITSPLTVKTRKKLYNIQYEGCANYVAKQVSKFKKALYHDKQVCIWYSSTDIDEYLGFLCVVDFLKDNRHEIYCCDCKNISESVAVLQHEDITADDAPPIIKMTRDNIREASDKWEVVAAEGEKIRIMHNGSVKILPEDHFDDIIFQISGTEPIKIIKICEVMLSEHTPRMLAFVLYRVNFLLEQNEFIMIEEGLLNKELYGNAKDFSKSIIQRTIHD